MSAFIGDLIIRALRVDELRQQDNPDKQLYQLVSELGYQSDKMGITITVPAGMLTDFASIPRPVWDFLDPEDPEILYPSVVHDYLYTLKGTFPDGSTFTREQADSVLREAMELQGASSLVRETVYQAVRAAGGQFWDAPKKPDGKF